MNKSILIALPIFLLINFMGVSENLPMFFDTASILIVLGGAIPFALCGSGGWFSVSRLSNAAEARGDCWLARRSLGSVIILGNFDQETIEWIGPACAVMALTVVYGYFVRALCRLAILSREAD